MQNTGEYISYIGIIKIEYYQTTKERQLFSIRMIRDGLRKMITCVQDIQEEIWFHQEHKSLKKKKNILGKGNDVKCKYGDKMYIQGGVCSPHFVECRGFLLE